MNPEALFSLPTDLEMWLFLGYAITVLAGARLTETLARTHFARAQRYGQAGFHYDADADHYNCPQGERLGLHLVDPHERVAVYRAPASSCSGCPQKRNCSPHEGGRRIFRPLAAWAETDVGRFHQWLSLFMAASSLVFCLIALFCWAGQPGTGLFVMALLIALAAIGRDARSVWESSLRLPKPAKE